MHPRRCHSFIVVTLASICVITDYFTRLWCIYEVAAYEFLQRHENKRRRLSSGGGVLLRSGDPGSGEKKNENEGSDGENVTGDNIVMNPAVQNNSTNVQQEQQDYQEERLQTVDTILDNTGEILFVPCPLLVIVAHAHVALLLALVVGFTLTLQQSSPGKDDEGDGVGDDDGDQGSKNWLVASSSSGVAYAMYLVAIMIVLLVPACIFASSLRSFMATRLELEDQLTTFTVKNAGCSDDRDRARVEQSIALWWKESGGSADGSGDPEADPSAALQHFDDYVHKEVAALVRAVTGRPTTPSYFLLVSTGLPVLFVSFDWSASFRRESVGLQLAWLIRGIVGVLLVPLLWHFFLVAALACNSILGRYARNQAPLPPPPPPPPRCSSKGTLGDTMATFLLALTIIAACVGVFGAEYQVSQHAGLPHVFTALLELLVVVCVTGVIWGRKWMEL